MLARTAFATLLVLAILVPSAASACCPGFFQRGDVNADGNVDLSDPICLRNTVLFGQSCVQCWNAADVNLDGAVDISDVIFHFNVFFNPTSNAFPLFPNCVPCTVPFGASPVESGCAEASITEHVLVVNHTTTEYDDYADAKCAVDSLVEEFATRGRPILYVLDRSPSEKWYTNSLTPTCTTVTSDGDYSGDTSVAIDTDVATVVGGYIVPGFQQCYPRAICATVGNYFANHPEECEIVINVPMDGVFQWFEAINSLGPLLKNGYDILGNIEQFFAGSCVTSYEDYYYIDPAPGEVPTEPCSPGVKRVRLKCWTSYDKMLDEI